MRQGALLAVAAGVLLAPPPAQAGGIGKAISGMICATAPARALILESLGLTAGPAALAGIMQTGHLLEAMVVDSGKLGAGYQPGTPVIITVTDAAACRFSVAPAPSAAKSPATGGKGTLRSSAMIGARTDPRGSGGAEMEVLEFQVDDKGRAVRQR